MITLTPTKLLILVVIVLIITIYARYYSKYSEGYNIIQTYLDKINLNLLYERSPIVIYDSIKTPKQLLKTLFKYSYMSKHEYTINTCEVHLSKSKFSFMFHTGKSNDTIIVNLINPIYKKDFKNWQKNKQGISFTPTPIAETSVEFVSVKLKPYQVLVLPTHWSFQVATSESVTKVDLDDAFTYFYFMF